MLKILRIRIRRGVQQRAKLHEVNRYLYGTRKSREFRKTVGSFEEKLAIVPSR